MDVHRTAQHSTSTSTSIRTAPRRATPHHTAPHRNRTTKPSPTQLQNDASSRRLAKDANQKTPLRLALEEAHVAAGLLSLAGSPSALRPPATPPQSILVLPTLFHRMPSRPPTVSQLVPPCPISLHPSPAHPTPPHSTPLHPVSPRPTLPPPRRAHRPHKPMGSLWANQQ